MKRLNLTQEQKEKLLILCQEKIFKSEASELGGTFSLSLTLDSTPIEAVKPIVLFKPLAYLKMTKLVKTVDCECGWHGVVTRDANVFTVHDILVYPQKATAATVESDDDAYAAWLDALPDETYNSIRLQGHSHVNMGVTPSTTDNDNRKTFLKMINQTTGYYIFMIANKPGLVHTCIYDMSQQLLFENSDITLDVLIDDDASLTTWVTSAVSAVKRTIPRTYTYDTKPTYNASGIISSIGTGSYAEERATYYDTLYDSLGTKDNRGKLEFYKKDEDYLDFCEMLKLEPNAEDYRTWLTEFNNNSPAKSTTRKYKGERKHGFK